MNHLRSFLLSSLVCTFLIGCQGRMDFQAAKLGPAGDTIRMSINSIGGLTAWEQVREVKATALLTLYNDQGQPFITQATIRIDPVKGQLIAAGPSGEGLWRATIDEKGQRLFETKGYSPVAEQQSRICDALMTVLAQVNGPLNFLKTDVQAGRASSPTIAGMRLTRVGISGNTRGVQAYYFDRVTGTLRFLTVGADQAAKPGSVTLFTYATLPDGMAFPKSMQVVKIGENILISDQAILEVNFSNVVLLKK